MKSILLIGLGRFGTRLAERLSETHAEVLAVDKSEKNVNAVLPFVTDALIGDGTDEEFIKTLGVQNFDACIVAIGTDFQSSLETASLLKESGAKRVISRASSDRQANLLLKIGADEIVFPEKQIADWAAIRYGADNVFDYLKISGEYSVFEVGVPESWTGKTVTEVDVRRKYGVNIVALKKNGTVDPVITPDTVFTAGETLLVLGKFKEMQKCFKM